ncbi:hypothetical protein CH254_18080 [Rhodococcus sp. 06-412-2C]|uniref:hypothetical protein n=1 Tax=unclassified Rhodococcus (in: high G+C Gram-positive bacteria) TaxID=192944 RepID=UPI000B9C03EE|nr:MULTISPECIES: hypothetical protein [unclassified Rhodococcus (in: high G+C Gram-positive bacteria)]OZC86450.1 hypothetical protein CH254_18080 [Rhodococcus sp. 06-412-2C]OZD02150.1 hypothetical protein CH279_04265 [Rhodococcus sp. 06-412-2B]
MGWGDEIEAREQAQRIAWEQDRKTLAELLLSRNEGHAAALVSIAEYRCDLVDNWDGGQYDVDIALPAVAFDRADDAVRAAMTKAARDIIGDGHFNDLTISVRRSHLTPDWDRDIFENFVRTGSSRSEQLGLPTSGDVGSVD